MQVGLRGSERSQARKIFEVLFYVIVGHLAVIYKQGSFGDHSLPLPIFASLGVFSAMFP